MALIFFIIGIIVWVYCLIKILDDYYTYAGLKYQKKITNKSYIDYVVSKITKQLKNKL